MKKRTAFIGAILPLISFGQPLIIKTSVVLSTTGLILSIPEKAQADSAEFFTNRGNKKLIYILYLENYYSNVLNLCV